MVRSSTGPHPYLVWLHDRDTSRELVGGKAASLSRLAALGAPVPPAFAITTTAYREFAHSLGVPTHAADVDASDLPDIRAAILTAPLPPAVAEETCNGYQSFQAICGDNVALAVRSSATEEDSATFSFAGLHDTVLDVRTPAALESAIRQCWASLWSDRAHAYRSANGHSNDTAEIAVVVQQLVRSDVSFVAFTSDPVHDRPDHLVITASWGLGEAIVSGLVVPDHVVVAPDGAIREYTIGRKELMVIPGRHADEGTRGVPVPRALQSQPALSEETIATITSMARSLSIQLGYDADFEGGIADGTLYLFQARPITTIDTHSAPITMSLEGQPAIAQPTYL